MKEWSARNSLNRKYWTNDISSSFSNAYKIIRQQYGLRTYDEKNKGNILIYAAEMFETNFMNNIKMHAKSHVRRFLNHLFPRQKIEVENTIYFLFYGESETSKPNKKNADKSNKCAPSAEKNVFPKSVAVLVRLCSIYVAPSAFQWGEPTEEF